MRIKTTTAFSALNRRHVREAREGLNFVVRALTKAGAVSKMPVNDQLDRHATAEAAEARRAELERLNPGRSFKVVEEVSR